MSLNLEGVIALAMRRKNAMIYHSTIGGREKPPADEDTRWAVLVKRDEMEVIVDEYQAQNRENVPDKLAQDYKMGVALLIIEGPDHMPIVILPEHDLVTMILKNSQQLNG